LSERSKLEQEIDSFRDLWSGGYFSADPSEQFAPFWFESMVGSYHVIYLACIKPWITPRSHVLEIGCGRGAWTRLFLGAAEVNCVDVLSAEHNDFHSYVGDVENVHYHQVEDFALDIIPDNSIEYVFSYDALCHVSFGGITEYARSLFRVMKEDAHGFIMVADYRKYNDFVDSLGSSNALSVLLPKRRYPMVRRVGNRLIREYSIWDANRRGIQHKNLIENDIPSPGRWYHAGTAETSDLLHNEGFTVLDMDMDVDPRSPVIHFQK
jgi:SAM-dependent methyltransferase